MPELWHKNAIVYCLDVDTFADDNGDGRGDFAGLTGKLDYLSGLNVSCIWLQPFYRSPRRDGGYDIADYYSVDPAFGSLGDFVTFSRKARDLGLRVILDLVVNHTSCDHPWFQAARRDAQSPYRDYYMWSEREPPDAHQGMVFPGKQKATWSWDEAAHAYFYHRFYQHEPELNIANPDVWREIEKIMAFWLELGAAGFRVDALPFVIEMRDAGGHTEEHYEYLRKLRHALSWYRGDAVLMAEANLPPEEAPKYFQEGDRVHVIFNFWANQHLFLALAREDGRPLRQAYQQLPPIPEECQWGNFLRTHDELDLGRLSEDERRDCFRAFGPSPEMQLYGRGIRRRLAPMLANDRRRIELAHSLMLTLPGMPVMRYGDEIGMGDDLSLDERNSIRTPMQWTSGPNGGFSIASEDRLVRPVVRDGEFGYPRVNVAAQQRDPDSLLNWVERATRQRRKASEFGSGHCTWIDTNEPAVLAHRCEDRGSAVLALHNLCSREVAVEFAIDREVACLHDMLANRPNEVDGGRHRLELEPYGYRWFREERRRDARGPRDRRPEFTP